MGPRYGRFIINQQKQNASLRIMSQSMYSGLTAAPPSSDIGSPSLEDMLVRRRLPANIALSESPELVSLPTMSGKTDISCATATQAASLLGVTKERINAVMLKRFHRTVKGIHRFDVRLHFAIKNGQSLDGISEERLAKARRELEEMEGAAVPNPYVFDPIGYDLIADLLNGLRPVKLFDSRLNAFEYLQTEAAKYISRLDGERLMGEIRYEQTAAYKGGKDADNRNGLWRGLRLAFTAPGIETSSDPRKRKTALVHALYGIGSTKLAVISDVSVFTPGFEKQPHGDDFTRQLAQIGARDPAFDRFWKPIEAEWDNAGISLERELFEAMRPETYYWRGRGREYLRALEAYAVIFSDLKSVIAGLQWALPLCIQERDREAEKNAKKAECLARRMEEAKLAAECQAREEAAELEEIAEENIRSAHRHLASLGLASAQGTAAIPNLYGVDAVKWKTFCDTPTAFVMMNRRKLKTFVGDEIGRLFGYAAELNPDEPEKGRIVLENGMTMPRHWLIEKTEFLMRSGVDVRTGELIRPDGAVTKPEELFFGIGRSDAAAKAAVNASEKGDAA